jgi:hypothetical protein
MALAASSLRGVKRKTQTNQLGLLAGGTKEEEERKEEEEERT